MPLIAVHEEIIFLQKGAIKQLSNYLKQEMFIFQPSAFEEVLLKPAWKSNSSVTGRIGQGCISLRAQLLLSIPPCSPCNIPTDNILTTRKTKPNQPHYSCMDTTYTSRKCLLFFSPLCILYYSTLMFLLPTVRTVPLNYNECNT